MWSLNARALDAPGFARGHPPAYRCPGASRALWRGLHASPWAFSLFLALAGCGAFDAAPLDITVAPVAIPAAPVQHPPPPAPLALVPFAFDVVPPGQISTEPAYCLDSRGYAALAHDVAEMKRWIADGAALIRHYRAPPVTTETTP